MTTNATVEQPVLRYQSGRTLAEVPGYETGLQLRLTTGCRVYIALCATELTLYFDTDLALHYDLEGRLLKASTPNSAHRRGFSNRVLFTRKRFASEGGGIERTLLPAEAACALVASAFDSVSTVFAEYQRGTAVIESAKPSAESVREIITPLLERAARFDARAARLDADRFRSIYGHIGMLPPDQYNALVLQVTQGCAYAGCLFCELYSGVKYARKSAEQFRDHVRRACEYHGKGLLARRSIFIGEANALALSQPALLEIFQVLNEHFEFFPSYETGSAGWWLGSATRFDGVSSFLDVFTGAQHSTGDFRALRELGLRRVYIGMESGDNTLLDWLRKPATAERLRQCVCALKEAGLTVGVIALLGAGGKKFRESHARETARVLNSLPLGAADYVYFSPLQFCHDSRYDKVATAMQIQPLSRQDMKEQEKQIRSLLRFDPTRGRPHVARYELENFLY